MGRAEIIEITDGYATVVFKGQGIQRRAQIMSGVEVKVGDIGVVVFTEGMMDCILIGVVWWTWFSSGTKKRLK